MACNHKLGAYTDQFGKMRCSQCNGLIGQKELDDYVDLGGEV